MFKNIITTILICSLIAIFAIEEMHGYTGPPSIENVEPPVAPTIMPTCIGNVGQVPWLVFENIPGSGEHDLNRMYHEPNYPHSPDRIQYLTSLASPPRYNNNFGSVIKGLIMAPETGDYVFNITGDDWSEFYFSDDSTKTTLTRIAHVPGYSGETDYDKYPEQTSDTFQLVAGDYYYFEAHQKEGGGGDFVRVQWKIPSTINATEWEVVHGVHLYEYLCDDICPKKGTACDDSDPTTNNDQEDGFCNCSGTPNSLPSECIGPRGTANALYWFEVSGTYISDLTSHSDYPMMPDAAVPMSRLSDPLDGGSQFGGRLRAFLKVPVSGDYEFNITANDEAALYLSSNPTIDPATDEIAYARYTDEFDHYSMPEQLSGTMSLSKDQFYAVELLFKENWSSEYYHVFWKTPWQTDTLWRIVDGSYLHLYGCELACIPEGTPCDDGDPGTFDDKYDDSCNCAGTPCADPACSNSLGYVPYDDCGNTGNHSTHPDDSWTSCQTAQSPNAIRPDGHWILYDFGEMYNLTNAQIWNYNVDGATGQGFKEVAIDYSLNGTDWVELGTYTWIQAPGSSDYSGFPIQDFENIVAQYVLFTALDNFNGTNCFGVSEISFSANECPGEGTACDDGDAATTNDVYDAFCRCNGMPISNSCSVADLIINDDPIVSGTYDAINTIISEGKVNPDSSVLFVAGQSVTWRPGFHAKNGSYAAAILVSCSPIVPPDPESLVDQDLPQNDDDDELPANLTWIEVAPNPTNSWTEIIYNVGEDSKIKLSVYSTSGHLITKLMNGEFQEKGKYTKQFPAQQLAGGVYVVTLQTENKVVTKRLIVID